MSYEKAASTAAVAGAVAGALAKPAIIVTQAVVDGITKLLNELCMPVAKEYFGLWQDNVRSYRTENKIQILARAKRLKEEEKNRVEGKDKVPPRILNDVLEKGSWSDDEYLQEMWAGLLVSSGTEDGTDDSNLVLSNLLGQMTTVQVKVINHFCEVCRKSLSTSGFVMTSPAMPSVDELLRVAGTQDIHRLDRDVDSLRYLGLLITTSNGMGGIDARTGSAIIWPSSLALYLYVRGRGFPGTLQEYWNLKDPYNTGTVGQSSDTK